MLKLTMLALMTFSLSNTAFGSLKLKNYQKDNDKKLAKNFERLKRPVKKGGCNHTMKTTIDWKSFDPLKTDKGRYSADGRERSPKGYCDIVFSLKSLCEKYGVEEIQKLKNYKCVYKSFKSINKNGKKWDMAKQGDTLILYTDFEGSNKPKFVGPWLENNL